MNSFLYPASPWTEAGLIFLTMKYQVFWTAPRRASFFFQGQAAFVPLPEIFSFCLSHFQGLWTYQRALIHPVFFCLNQGPLACPFPSLVYPFQAFLVLKPPVFSSVLWELSASEYRTFFWVFRPAWALLPRALSPSWSLL